MIMASYFLSGIINKGKAFLENVKPSFLKSSKEIEEVCEGLMKTSNQMDTKKLNDANPYFKRLSSKELPKAVLMVVGFHHKKGAVIEYVYPEEEKVWLQSPEYEDFTQKICFVAIPDAIHTLDVTFLHPLERLRLLHHPLPRSAVVRRLMLPAGCLRSSGQSRRAITS
eukprot:TRINITY_DN12443_c0_g1_i1.p1 TRINITY_DN12443_c0_g1~~TRINITY_DN12443_c0_g1_i1.p1  ORF type:complete len:168 (+),score=29.40 TRINITY_DN12443_c0_g1_i1:84-587(+)